VFRSEVVAMMKWGGEDAFPRTVQCEREENGAGRRKSDFVREVRELER